MGGFSGESFTTVLTAIIGTYGPVGGLLFMAGLVLYRTGFMRGNPPPPAGAPPELLNMRSDLQQIEKEMEELRKAHGEVRERMIRFEENFRWHWDRMEKQDHRMNNIEQRQQRQER